MAAITLYSPEPTQITLSTTVTDTVTLPASAQRIVAGRQVTVFNLSGATTLRVTVGAVGAAADPNGATATLIPTGKSRTLYVGSAACDVKVVGSANVYSITRGEEATAGDTPTVARYGALRSFATVDVASLVDAAGATSTVSCIGAALGDYAQVSHNLDVQGISVTAYVSAADTVSVRFQNESGGTIDLASGTVRVRVFK